jgi:hypothetical protein
MQVVVNVLMMTIHKRQQESWTMELNVLKDQRAPIAGLSIGSTEAGLIVLMLVSFEQR